jgi:serine O-acetyltransferase
MKSVVFKILYPFTILYVKMKFKDIWHLKEFLFQFKRQSVFFTLLLNYYERTLRKLGSWIGINAIFNGIPYFPHGAMGVFIAHHTIIGKNVIIFQQVTIGSNYLKESKKFGTPTIGDNVYIGAGAKIIGKITIGNNCRIGANAVVVEDMPDSSVAVAAQTRIIQKDNLNNRFYIDLKDKTLYYDNGIWKTEIVKS